MSHRHQISKHYSILGYRSRPEDVTPPDAPENLRGRSSLETAGAELTWDAPDTGGTIFYYEVFVNDEHWANSTSTDAQYPNAEVNDVFKVRAVGVLGLKSAFSNTWTYEGGEQLTPTVTGYAESLHMEWNDISDTDQVNFEGYNVYRGGVKQNSQLLSADVNAYPFFNLAAGSEHTVAVSFEHDGGQESDLFDITGTVGSKGLPFQVSIRSGYRSYPLVGITGKVHPWWDVEGGVIVEEGTRVTVSPLFKPRYQYDHPEWSTIDTYTRTYFLQAEGGSAEMEFNAGCSNNSNILLRNTLRRIIVNTDEVHQINGGISHNWNSKISGSQCGNRSFNESISFRVSIAEEDFKRIGDYSTSSYDVFRIPRENEGRLVAETDSGNNSVTFRWSAYFSLPYVKLFIKDTNNSNYPSDPYHSGFLTNDNNLYVVDDLSDGDYNAKLEYYLGDQSTLITTSDDVDFIIDTS